MGERSGQERRFSKTAWTLGAGNPFKQDADSRTESLQAIMFCKFNYSCRRLSNMQRGDAGHADVPQCAAEMRRGPQFLIQQLKGRGEIKGDIVRAFARDVRLK